MTEKKIVGGAVPMRHDIKIQNSNFLRQIAAMKMEQESPKDDPTALIVTIPETVLEGMHFVVATKDQKQFLVECPIGAKPGNKIRILIPNATSDGPNGALTSQLDSSKSPAKPSSSASAGQHQFKLFDIVVPPGAQPNQLLPVNVYGKRVPVRLPSTVVEGQTITLKIPLQDVVGDLELDYEQVDTSLTGGRNRTIRMEDFKFQWVNSNLQPQLSENNALSTRSISTAAVKIQNAIRDIAFVRNVTKLAGNDPRLPTATVELIPASEAVTESEFRLHPFSKPLMTYATAAHYIQSRSSLDIKQEWLYQYVFDPIKQFAGQDGTKVMLVVRRSSLLEDSLRSVMSLSQREMCKPWQIEFLGEPALDYGGVMRGKQTHLTCIIWKRSLLSEALTICIITFILKNGCS
jgi:hypothetical protein